MSVHARATGWALVLAACGVAAPAVAQDTMQGMDMPLSQHDHGHGAPQHAEPAQPSAAPAANEAHEAREAGHAMDMSSMQGGDAPPDARSPDYSDGYRYGSMEAMDMHDDPALGMLLLDRLEFVHARGGGNGAAIDGEAWYGRNINKLWLKFEGENPDGPRQDLRVEALWAHAVAPFWDTQLGVRHDSGDGPDRSWAAFGVEGLAPYRFETEATFYLGQDGRTAARISFEYEARFTQRLVLQPSLEANFYGKDDPQRGIGSGLSNAELGLRLRYEIRREFAPYVGVVWQQAFGRSADFARAQGEPAGDLQFVAGFRIWF